MSNAKLRKGDVVVVENKTRADWCSYDGSYTLHWTLAMDMFIGRYYIVSLALRLTDRGQMVECEEGQFALLQRPNDGPQLCDATTPTHAPFLFPADWLRVCTLKEEAKGPFALKEKPEPVAKLAHAPVESLMNGITPANYVMLHPIYKWRRDAPWDPEDIG